MKDLSKTVYTYIVLMIRDMFIERVLNLMNILDFYAFI